MQAESIIEFWYSDRIKSQWFNSTVELDQEIKDSYESVWMAVSAGEYDNWQDSSTGSLALVIILDQFPLNMFRGKIESFKTEAKAIEVAKHAISQKQDQQLDKDKLAFLYLPLMHSENMNDQNYSVELFEKAGLLENAKFAKHHRDIVQRFGRFPHRNIILGRNSTQAELDYLTSDEAFKG